MLRRVVYGLLLYISASALLVLSSMNPADWNDVIAVYVSLTVLSLCAVPFIFWFRRRGWLLPRHFILAGMGASLAITTLVTLVFDNPAPLLFVSVFCVAGAIHGFAIWLVAVWRNRELLGDAAGSDNEPRRANDEAARHTGSTLVPLLGLALGAFYGLSVRSIFELLTPFGIGLVSISFFFVVPFVIGYLRVYFEARAFGDMAGTRAVSVAWQPVLVFLFATFVTFIEGAICIFMALPAFLFFAGLGGIVARAHYRSRHRKATVASFVVLPLLLAPVESALPPVSNVYEVSNSIVIDAAPHDVWRELGTVAEIAEAEVPIGIARMIGIPRPLRADMSGAGVGAVRTSTWEKGVVFEEVITSWQPGRLMAYEFRIDPGLIPDSALDKHVKLGGEFFSPLHGRYELAAMGDGATRLTLSTVVEDNTRFGIYSRIWGELIFRDFHNSLLAIIRNRSEGTNAAGAMTSR